MEYRERHYREENRARRSPRRKRRASLPPTSIFDIVFGPCIDVCFVSRRDGFASAHQYDSKFEAQYQYPPPPPPDEPPMRHSNPVIVVPNYQDDQRTDKVPTRYFDDDISALSACTFEDMHNGNAAAKHDQEMAFVRAQLHPEPIAYRIPKSPKQTSTPNPSPPPSPLPPELSPIPSVTRISPSSNPLSDEEFDDDPTDFIKGPSSSLSKRDRTSSGGSRTGSTLTEDSDFTWGRGKEESKERTP